MSVRNYLIGLLRRSGRSLVHFLLLPVVVPGFLRRSDSLISRLVASTFDPVLAYVRGNDDNIKGEKVFGNVGAVDEIGGVEDYEDTA